jgi:ankyrin repeat protein
LQNGEAALHSRDEFGSTTLHWAAIQNLSALSELLIKFGADVNAQNRQGQTPLHIAMNAGHTHADMVKFLISKGARKDIKNVFGWTPVDGLRPDEDDEAMRLMKINMGARAVVCFFSDLLCFFWFVLIVVLVAA